MTEWTEQREVIQWFKSIYPQYEKSIRLSMSGLNLGGGIKAAKMINQMKAQGYVKGETDLLFCVPRGKYHGLFIEMKDFGKKPTPDQLEYLYYQVSMGYKAEYCEGSEAAIKVISDYMNSVRKMK